MDKFYGFKKTSLPSQTLFVLEKTRMHQIHVVLYMHNLYIMFFPLIFLLPALKQLMLEKEAELALTNNELAELEEYQVMVSLVIILI